jgi:putative sterol carrier protein
LHFFIEYKSMNFNAHLSFGSNILTKTLICGQVLRRATVPIVKQNVFQQPHQLSPALSRLGALRTFADSSSPSLAVKILETARDTISDDVKKEINSVIVFNISGKQYLLDAHESRPLKLEEVSQPPEKVDFTMITDEATFLKLAKGETKPTTAFMTGKMKIKGDMGKAMKAQKLFAALKVPV